MINEIKNENLQIKCPLFVVCEKKLGSDNPVLIDEKYALVHHDLIFAATAVHFLPLDPAHIPWFSFRPVQTIKELRQFMTEFPQIEGLAFNPRCSKIGAAGVLNIECDTTPFGKMSFAHADGISPVKSAEDKKIS